MTSLDGSYAFDLSHVLNDSNSSKCDRSVRLLDDKGRPFVVTTVSNKTWEDNVLLTIALL